MKTLVILICVTIAFGQSGNDPTRLPLYIGRGYDVLEGNPLSSKVDPGFAQGIFVLKYTEGKTTEDGRYLVPDEAQSRQVSSCFLSSNTQTYRGTQSYQSELKTKVAISGGYKGLIFQAAFSASTTYEKMEKQTIERNMTLTHAMAECQAYELAINIFDVPTFDQNFISGVNESYYANDWENFFIQFGTHFVFQTIMGGRATQEIAYQSQTISKLESLNIDVNVAAKASFAKFYMDSSFDWSKHTQEISYAQTTSSSISQIYIGGEPSKDGDIRNWIQKVKDNPMPITYKVMEISNLFRKIKGLNIDFDLAIKQFNTALDNYCKGRYCKLPNPDKPKPLPAQLQMQQTVRLGGGGGVFYSHILSSTTMSAMKFSARVSNEIDQFQVYMSDGVRAEYLPKQGGGGGTPIQYTVPKGQYVKQVEIHWGNRLIGILFITNLGTRSVPFGDCQGGYYSMITFPEDFKIIGVFGAAGDRVDSLGFYIGKAIFPKGGQPYLETRKVGLLSNE